MLLQLFLVHYDQYSLILIFLCLIRDHTNLSEDLRVNLLGKKKKTKIYIRDELTDEMIVETCIFVFHG